MSLLENNRCELKYKGPYLINACMLSCTTRFICLYMLNEGSQESFREYWALGLSRYTPSTCGSRGFITLLKRVTLSIPTLLIFLQQIPLQFFHPLTNAFFYLQGLGMIFHTFLQTVLKP
jgi:hypothetical protein